eukprot:3217155-Amphidinium_carterae.2
MNTTTIAELQPMTPRIKIETPGFGQVRAEAALPKSTTSLVHPLPVRNPGRGPNDVEFVQNEYAPEKK